MTHVATLTLVEEMQFRARMGSGHEFTLDAGPGVGGGDAGARPMELVLAALAGCGSMDVIAILRKMRQDVTSYEVTASGETAAEHPKRYVSVELVHRLRGRGIVEANARRAIQLSISRYCPVYAMLSPTVPITVRYEIGDEASGAEASGLVEVEAAGAA